MDSSFIDSSCSKTDDESAATSVIRLGNSDSEFKLISKNVSIKNSNQGGEVPYTLEELNLRIGKLTDAFTRFTTDDFYFDTGNDRFDKEDVKDQLRELRIAHRGNACDRRNVSQFSSNLSIQSSLKSRMKISNSTLGNLKGKRLSSLSEKLKKTMEPASSSKKPMLVELHVYPGYNEMELTPLPPPLDVNSIIRVVIGAQTDLHKKAKYRRVFIKFFNSENTKAILQDLFWWFFCHKYHASPHQANMFNRISMNFTNLVITWNGTKYQDTLFKSYANLLSQGIYATFCHSFPTSYRQFNGEFRDELIALASLWLMGSRPAPRYWETWNFSMLEPFGLRKGELFQEDVISRARPLELDFTMSRGRRTSTTRRRSSLISFNKVKNVTSTQNVILQNSRTEVKEEDKCNEPKTKVKQLSSVLDLAEKDSINDSCAAGEVPQFSRAVFDVYGRSPLIEHFLLKHNLSKDCGTSVLGIVNLRDRLSDELLKLSMSKQKGDIQSRGRQNASTKCTSLDSKTYDDFVMSRRCTSDELYENYLKSWRQTNRERQNKVFAHKIDNSKYSRCCNKLLSDPHKVRKISDLLNPDAKEEPDDFEIRTTRLRYLLAQALEEDHA